MWGVTRILYSLLAKVSGYQGRSPWLVRSGEVWPAQGEGFIRAPLAAGGPGGGISDTAPSQPVATPGEFADLMWCRIVLRSTPVRRSISGELVTLKSSTRRTTCSRSARPGVGEGHAAKAIAPPRRAARRYIASQARNRCSSCRWSADRYCSRRRSVATLPCRSSNSSG